MTDTNQLDGVHSRGARSRDDTVMTARRVAAAKYDLERIKRDVCQWLREILELDITPQTFLDTLDTGVVLCQLVDLIQEKANALKEAGEQVDCKIPLEPIKYRSSVQKSTFHARENTKYFIDWCRSLGVRDDFIFETNGLVEHADEKRVLLCLLEVSRFARKLNIKPPAIVSEQEEAIVAAENDQKRVEAVSTKPEGNETASMSANISESIKPNTDDITNLNEPQESHPPETNSPVNKPPPSGESQEAVAVRDDSEDNSYSPFRDYCSYPFLFSLLLLLLLLGGGFFLRRRK